MISPSLSRGEERYGLDVIYEWDKAAEGPKPVGVEIDGYSLPDRLARAIVDWIECHQKLGSQMCEAIEWKEE